MKVSTSNWLFGIMMIALIAISFLVSSCAQTCQRIKANGSIVGTVSGAWIFEKYSGGVITDVFKLDNALVKSEQGSDGWIFTNQDGNVVHIGGDMKAIRCSNNRGFVFDQFVEYHLDVDMCTYKEKFEKSKGKITATNELINTLTTKYLMVPWGESVYPFIN
jgi:hypothetical protein